MQGYGARDATEAPEGAVLHEAAAEWFCALRDRICAEFEKIESELAPSAPLGERPPGRFTRKGWQRQDRDGAPGGGGTMALMRGRVFEKVGVNVSAVEGHFPPGFAAEIPGAAESGGFFRACGISLVAHMQNPLVPAAHMNTRRIETSKSWFGGGSDLTPTWPDPQDTQDFHAALEACCDRHGPGRYAEYKAWCDRYFFLPHRGEPRGVGGIFYDYLESGDKEADFAFTRDVGETFLDIYPRIVRRAMARVWTPEQKESQKIRRGRYVEFNLLHDRGTRFGLMTGGNVEAILMSLPPEAAWPGNSPLPCS